MSAGHGLVRPFTPQRESVAALADRTVARGQLLEAVTGSLEAAATSRARPHVLIVGPPGTGKSHMVELLVHRTRTEPGLRDRLVVVRATAAGLGVSRFEDLLTDVLAVLTEGDGSGPPASTDSATRIGELLGDRVVLLVIENLPAVFAALGTAGQRALRAWVETSGHVLLLTTAPTVFPGVRDRDQPWFGGLGTYLLPELDLSHAQELVAHVADRLGDQDLAGYVGTATGEARLRTFADLLGSVPRAWLILATAGRDDFDEVTPAVLSLLDALVPQHEHVLTTRSPNERRLIAALAASTGSATVSELASLAGLEQRTAASALGRLAGSGVVLAEKPAGIDRRTSYYRVRDPLLRLHLWYRTPGDDVLALTAALLRAHHDPGVRRPLQDATADRLRAGDVVGALAVADRAGPAGERAAREAEVALAAAARVDRGAEVVPVGSAAPARRLLGTLLAAAGGDAAARASLPPQWRRLVPSGEVTAGMRPPATPGPPSARRP